MRLHQVRMKKSNADSKNDSDDSTNETSGSERNN